MEQSWLWPAVLKPSSYILLIVNGVDEYIVNGTDEFVLTRSRTYTFYTSHKKTAVQNEAAFSYLRVQVRGLYVLKVVFATTIVTSSSAVYIASIVRPN